MTIVDGPFGFVLVERISLLFPSENRSKSRILYIDMNPSMSYLE